MTFVVLALGACSRDRGPTGSTLAGASVTLRPTPAATRETTLATVAPRRLPRPITARPLTAKALVGKSLFFDPKLSGSGKSCHDPAHAYGPPNDLPVQLGGKKGTQQGGRAVPSLRYKEYTPPYADLLDNPDGISAPGPGGGFAWDGRAATLAEQARLPLLSPLEMANDGPEDVARKVRAAPYAADFQRAFGDVSTDSVVFEDVLAALQAFQLEDPSFHPYDSKFDLHADNKIGGTFTPAEARGFRVFVDPATGNCASCHYTGAGINGSSGLFTDFSYAAIGVPRNPAIEANRDPSYFDLGICGPLRTDHRGGDGAENRFCGLFKTPTLRNAATRKVFFHNGVIHSLEQAVRFYVTRDTRPELWYPTVGGVARAAPPGFPDFGLVKAIFTGGKVQKFDDLPPQFSGNIDPQLPLDGRARGSKPPLTEQNIQDLLCFLDTLTDGYVPPADPPHAGRCVD